MSRDAIRHLAKVTDQTGPDQTRPIQNRPHRCDNDNDDNEDNEAAILQISSDSILNHLLVKLVCELLNQTTTKYVIRRTPIHCLLLNALF